MHVTLQGIATRLPVWAVKATGVALRRRHARAPDHHPPSEYRLQLRRCVARYRLAALTEYHSVATPGNWKKGQDVVMVHSLQDPEEIKRRFPQGYKAVTPYPRL